MLLLTLFVSLSVFAERISFFTDALSLKLGGDGDVIAAGDFNGDGKQDLVRQSFSGTGKLAVLPGIGDGTFGTPIETVIGVGSLRATGDVNGDGRPDLLFSVIDNSTAWMLLSSASGEFSASATLTLAQSEFHLSQIADATGDGKADVIVANLKYGSESLAVFAGDGAGAFAAPVVTMTGLGIESLHAVDVNDDGRADVLFRALNELWIRLAQANGGWSPRTSLGPGVTIAASDFDGDGHIDVATDSRMMLGHGDGTFTQGASHDLPPHGRLLAKDLNGDGRDDLVALVGNSAAAVAVNAGDATFELVQGYAIPATFVADFDSDGHLDLLGASTHQLAPGNGDGKFRANAAYATTVAGSSCYELFPRGIAAGDVTGDGNEDVILLTLHLYGGTTLTTLPSLGDGRLGPRIVTSLAINSPGFMVAADFDHDDLTDVAFRGNHPGSHLMIYLANGDGTFRAAADRAVTTYGQLFAFDFTADGHRDVAMIDDDGVHVYPGDGAGGLAEPVASAINATFGVEVADLNGDGDPDLVADGATGLQIHLGAAGATFGPAGVPFDPQHSLSAIGDLDGDGAVELILGSATGLRIRSSLGNGTFGSARDLVAPQVYESVIADVDGDGDGDLDLAGATSVLFGDGEGSFDEYGSYRGSASFALADLDGNGTLDFVTPSCPMVAVRLTGIAPSLDLPVTITSSSAQMMYGVTYGTSVTFQHNTGYSPEGYVTLRENDELLAVAPVLSHGAFPSFALGLGVHEIDVEYGGDQLFAPASTTMTLTGVQCSTTLNATATPTSAGSGENIVIAVTLAPLYTLAEGFDLPAGTIELREGASVLDVKAAQASTSFTVNDLSPGTHTLTIAYSGDTNYVSSTDTVEVTIHVPFAAFPIQATALSTSSIAVSWPPVVNASSYDVYRRIANGDYVFAVTVSSPGWIDTGRTAATTHFYKVLARNGANTTPLSAPDLATTVVFSDVVLSGAVVKTVHLTELRTAINAVRAAANLAAFTFAEAPAVGSIIRASQLSELRNALAQARNDLGLATSFTDPIINAGSTTLRAVHIQELRDGTM